jgi:hypothetical protein
MDISRDDLKSAVQKGLLTNQQEDSLWLFLLNRNSARIQDSFNLTNVIYYFGALIVMSAMAWFMTEAWQKLGGGGFMIVSIIYALAFIFAGQTLWYDKKLKVPGGLLYSYFLNPRSKIRYTNLNLPRGTEFLHHEQLTKKQKLKFTSVTDTHPKKEVQTKTRLD